MKYALRVDSNQAEVVEALRKLGLKVYLGHDDFLVSDGVTLKWYELKTKSGRLTAGQKTLERELPGCYKVVLSSSDKRDNAHEFYQSLGFEQHGYSFVVDLGSRDVHKHKEQR